MKIGIATFCSPDVAELQAMTDPNRRAYAAKHGYDYTVLSTSLVADPRMGWHAHAFERFRAYRSLLVGGKYDWLFCCGADVIFTNPEIPIEPKCDWSKGFIIANDAGGLNSDVFIARNCSRTLELLQAVVDLRDRHWCSPLIDQDALDEVLPDFQDIVKIVPQKELQSHLYDAIIYKEVEVTSVQPYVDGKDKLGNDGQWKPGDFALHAAGFPYAEKIAVLSKILKEIGQQ